MVWRHTDGAVEEREWRDLQILKRTGLILKIQNLNLSF